MRCNALQCEAVCAREEERFSWLGFPVGCGRAMLCCGVSRVHPWTIVMEYNLLCPNIPLRGTPPRMQKWHLPVLPLIGVPFTVNCFYFTVNWRAFAVNRGAFTVNWGPFTVNRAHPYFRGWTLLRRLGYHLCPWGTTGEPIYTDRANSCISWFETCCVE